MQTITADDLRAELARRRLPVYVLAARVRLHPVRLGRLLSRRLTLTPELATRILDGIRSEETATAQ